MKTILICIVATLTSLQAMAQELTDTVKVVSNPREVTVTATKDGTRFTINGTTENPDFYYSYFTSAGAVDSQKADNEWGLSLPFLNEGENRKKYNTVWLQDTYVGITNPLDAPEGLSRSVAVGIGKVVGASLQPWRKGPTFAVGVGIHFEQYTLHGRQLFMADGKHLDITDLPADASAYHSRLLNYGIQIPLTITQSIYKDFGFSIGASLMFNTYTKATANYTLDNVEYSTAYTGLQQRAATVDLYFAIGRIDEYGLFVRYSPTPLMRDGYGPQFKNITFGLTLGF